MSDMMLKTRPRGIVGVRADGSNATEILANLNKTFEEFKAQRETELKGIKAKFDDVVQKEQVDRINTEITGLTTALEEMKTLQASMQIGAAAADVVSPEVLAHSNQFHSWFRQGDRALGADMRELEVSASLTTQSDPDGGYLVPEQMEATIDRVLGAVSAMRGLSRVLPISASTYKKLVNKGGTGSGWVGESGARPETNTPQLAEIVINAEELYAMPASTQRALDDAGMDIAQWLADEVSIEFAEQEGTAFITGNGVDKPKGILSYSTVLNTNYTWGKIGHTITGAAAGFAASDPSDALIALYYSLKAGYRNGASWLMSDKVQEDVRKFKDGQGNYIWAPPTAEMPALILGKPTASDDNMHALGANKYPISFGNFQRGYLIVDRSGVRVLRDPFTSKPNVLFYTTKRVGGGVTNFEAIKHLKCST